MERWAPFKELWSTIQDIVLRKNDSAYHHFRALLRKHKPDLLNLLKNPARNSEHRAKVKKAVNEGLILEGEPTARTFSQDFIDESLIISDLFELNEYSAVELLLEGEHQLPHYPKLTRGLVSVLLYWDGRKSLVSTLKTLIQCRKGQTWTLEVSDEVANAATVLTDELLENGLTKQILKLVSTIQVEKEIENLSKQRGLGDVKHRKQVRDLITEVRTDLGECLFYFAGQSNLPLTDTLSILDHLEKSDDVTPDGKMSTVSLALLHSVFYAFALPQDIPIEQDDRGLDTLLQHPLIAEKDFVQGVHRKLMKRDEWKVPGIKACVQLAWSLTLRTLSQIPMAVADLAPDTFNASGFTDALEQDETVLGSALSGKAFQFLKENVVGSGGFHSEEFYVRRIHGIVTDLIVNMPLKVKEMRNHGDEVARILMLHMMEGEEPPNLPEDFKQLMELITALYEKDPSDLELTAEYWCPPNENMQVTVHQSGSFIGDPRLNQRLPQRQISLFKFLRQSGDLLPPLLYIPYLKMLAALSTGTQSARMAFEMLRMNGANMGVATEGSNVSWDHFFASFNRYYVNLRQERSQFEKSGPFVATLGAASGQHLTAQVLGSHLHSLSITPQEVEGLRAVLQLVAKIAEYDDIACLTIYEHPQWNACNGLLGLLQCPVPAVLKGDVLLALNQLSRLPEIAVGLLHSMESLQILGSHTGSSSSQALEMELEEVESREEQYHMTCSFLKLLCTLTETSTAISLTATSQSQGFELYLRFAIEKVFLKFLSRSYKRKEEKWEVALSAMKVFTKLLAQYVPQPEDFVPEKRALESSFAAAASQDSLGFSMNSSLGGLNANGMQSTQVTTNKPPGYYLLVHIMNEGNFFKTVMQVIEECISYLDTYSVKKELEGPLAEAGSFALQILQLTLDLQGPFLACMRESGCSVLVNTLDKLLLGINSRTGKADFVVTVAKFVIHNATHPELSLRACEILSCLCRISAATQREIFAMVTSLCNPQTRAKILHGFVGAIESPEPEADEDSAEETYTAALHNSKCRLAILRLLLYCVDLPAPNLSHFLLGFNLSKAISKSSLEDPGVLGSPRTCLHSVLAILSSGMESPGNTAQRQPTAITETPALAELCYQLVYRLSANAETTGPILRYLRSSQDFVFRHLQHVPFEMGGIAKENHLLLQQAWLLKTAAIELHSTAMNRQRSHTQRLVQALFCKQASLSATLLEGGDTTNITSMQSLTRTLGIGVAADTSISAAMSTLNATSLTTGTQQQQEKPRILQILDVVDFTQEFPEPLVLEQFVPANVENAIQSCETKSEHGLAYCDIKALHELLEANVNTLQGTDDAGRRPLATQEVQNILKNAVERNQTRQSVHSKLAFLNSWKHALEVALNSCPSDLMQKEAKQQILLDILQELLIRVSDPEAISELTSPVASICLTLVTHLRTCFMGSADFQRHSAATLSMNITRDQNMSRSVQESSGQIPASISGSLQVIIRGVIEWLMQAGVEQKVRANLYASLLYYMQMCQKPKGATDERALSTSVSSLRALPTDIYSKLARDNVKLFRMYGDPLMELICKDACEGHSVCKILAFSCLDAIVQIDWEKTWLQFMIKKGYINNIAHSFTVEDESLQQALNPNPEPLQSLYIYEQKMAFLGSLARTHGGARAVLDAGVLTKLAECTFLEMRPAADDASYDSFIPSVMSRYRQLLFPALNLCSSILATLGGTSHREACALVLEFMLAHSDSIINPVLRLQPIPDNIQTLRELKYVTGILCQVAGQDFSNENLYSSIPPAVLVELQGHLSKIQRQLLHLLPHYCVQNDWIREIERTNKETQGREDVQEIILLVHEVCANIISYCTVLTRPQSHDTESAVLLFSASLEESSERDAFRLDYPGSVQQQTLGLLVRTLQGSVTKFGSIQDSVALLRQRVDNVSNLSTQELREVTTAEDETLSIPQRQAVAAVKLQNEMKCKEQLLSTLYFTMENSLLLLWQHLDHFIVKSSAVDTRNEGILFQNKKHMPRTQPRKLQDVTNMQDISAISPEGTLLKPGLPLGVTREELRELKRLLPACITDRFLTKLCDIEELCSSESRCVFMRPIVRRLQRIIRLHTSV